MEIASLVILLAFMIFRNSFTLIKGKRSQVNVSTLIYLGRKMIEIFISFLIPFLLILGILDTKIYAPLYYLGLAVSIIGLWFMIWTRFNRNKDWGFMGDKSGEVLFTDGVYRFTRHPYYFGAVMVGIGLYLQLNYQYVLLMVPVVLFIHYVIKVEDRHLEEKFGQKFIDYKNKVGVIPWLGK